MRLLRQAWLLTRNDLRQELRNFELVLTSGFFTFVLLIMFALAFDNLSETAQHKAVPGMVWLSVAFIGVLTLTRVFDRERESQTLGALLVAPTARLAIYLAKVTFTVLVLSLCAAILVPGLVLIFPGASGFAARPAATAPDASATRRRLPTPPSTGLTHDHLSTARRRHLRGDRRHMQERDAFEIREGCSLPLNFEMGVTEVVRGVVGVVEDLANP